ncbi:MAG: hypothetical protein AAFV07_05885 [Bacteroidota bacterium]
MDLQIHSAQKLTWRDNLGLWDLLILAVGGAGLLLMLSAMKQYGFQSWYRLPYWFGGLTALAALIPYGLFLPRIQMTWMRGGMVTWKRRKGLRLVEEKSLPLEQVQAVVIEDGRLYMQTDQEAICLSVRPVTDASRLETAQREFLGFLKA